MTDVEVLLTRNGEIPIHYNFLLHGVIHHFQPEPIGMILVHKIRNAKLREACNAYLKDIGADFISMEQVNQWANTHSLPNFSDDSDIDIDEEKIRDGIRYRS